MAEMIAYGYVAGDASPTAKERMAQFTLLLGKQGALEVAVCETSSYEDLARAVHEKQIDVAWLPPIPFIALEKRGDVVPLVSHHRGGSPEHCSVLIVHKFSPIPDLATLHGTRAAWVDKHSSSGYVLPRIEMAAAGVDPRATFAAERFFGSHQAVVRAVVDRKADVGATYAGVDATGAIVRGAWLDMPDADEHVRVLATFGAIPGDVTAARADLPDLVREKIAWALVALSHDKQNRLLIDDVFGVEEFRRGIAPGYNDLRRATMDASDEGLLQGDEHGPME
jgi:phosphate/phosphite/phosphonate ABC transporter binding protein